MRQELADSSTTQQCPGWMDGWTDGGVVMEEVGRNRECEKEKKKRATPTLPSDAEKSCVAAPSGWASFKE